MLLTLTTDATGNFHSQERVSFGSGLFADAKGPGTLHPMQAAVTSGRCNSCHVAGSRIRVD